MIDKEFKSLDTQLYIEGSIKSLDICIIGGYAFLKSIKPYKDRTFTLDADALWLKDSNYGENKVPTSLDHILNSFGIEYLNSRSLSFSNIIEYEDEFTELEIDNFEVIRLVRLSLELLIVMKMFSLNSRHKDTDKYDLYNPNLPKTLSITKIKNLFEKNLIIEN